MNLQENVSRIREVMGLITEEEKDPISVLENLSQEIDKLLSFYMKSEDGKFYDAADTEQKKPVDLLPTASFLKAKVESVIYGAKKQNKYTPQLEEIKLKITDGKFKEFFGDWNNISVQPQKFDYYTGTKCTTPNKNPGCGPTV